MQTTGILELRCTHPASGRNLTVHLHRMAGRSSGSALSTGGASLLNNVERPFIPIADEHLPLWEFDYNGALLPQAIDAGSLGDYKEHLWTKAILMEMCALCRVQLSDAPSLCKRLLLTQERFVLCAAIRRSNLKSVFASPTRKSKEERSEHEQRRLVLTGWGKTFWPSSTSKL
jgi:hypothetical protein